MIKIAPSLLSADFSKLKEDIQKIESGGADLLHLDVMDGHFVNNITFGPIVVEGIRKLTTIPLDVHLMIDNPEKWVEHFISAGADWVSFHIEATEFPQKTIDLIKNKGKQAGITINPPTPLKSIMPFVPSVNFVLVMTVNPGFGGQGFIREPLEKVKLLSKETTVEVDGGIKLSNAKEVIDAGAHILVSGSGVFHTPDPAATIKEFKKL